MTQTVIPPRPAPYDPRVAGRVPQLVWWAVDPMPASGDTQAVTPQAGNSVRDRSAIIMVRQVRSAARPPDSDSEFEFEELRRIPSLGP